MKNVFEVLSSRSNPYNITNVYGVIPYISRIICDIANICWVDREQVLERH
jgi:hypothetical protein